jgi:hypothetical protein
VERPILPNGSVQCRVPLPNKMNSKTMKLLVRKKLEMDGRRDEKVVRTDKRSGRNIGPRRSPAMLKFESSLPSTNIVVYLVQFGALELATRGCHRPRDVVNDLRHSRLGLGVP